MFQEEYTNLEYFAFAFTVGSLVLLAYVFLKHAREITCFFVRVIKTGLEDEIIIWLLIAAIILIGRFVLWIFISEN